MAIPIRSRNGVISFQKFAGMLGGPASDRRTHGFNLQDFALRKPHLDRMQILPFELRSQIASGLEKLQDLVSVFKPLKVKQVSKVRTGHRRWVSIITYQVDDKTDRSVEHIASGDDIDGVRWVA